VDNVTLILVFSVSVPLQPTYRNTAIIKITTMRSLGNLKQGNVLPKIGQKNVMTLYTHSPSKYIIKVPM